MYTTQAHLSIENIKDDIILLKEGGGSLVIKTNAVNFGLLSDVEQVSIITSFAQMLNSLSFSIQILIQSQRLDVTAYIRLLEMAQRSQINALLAGMIAKYRMFIQSLVKENEVLDKQFYIVLSVSSIELGLSVSDEQDRINKIKTILNPRRDQISRQLSRVGLRAEQMNTERLIKLFYDVYNQTSTQSSEQVAIKPNLIQPVRLANPNTVQKPISNIPIAPPLPVQPTTNPLTGTAWQTPTSRSHPFVVEELTG